MSNILFSKHLKVADIISANPNLILLFPRVGIPLGFGESTIEEVCKLHGIPVDFLVLLCNVYSFDNYIPTEKTLKEMDMSFLKKYLTESHEYYQNKRIPHIGAHLQRIIDCSDPKIGPIIKKFFDGYSEDVERHFAYEETYVFPHLDALINGNPDPDYRIASFLESHTNIEDKLSDLIKILLKYLPNSLPDQLIEIVFDTVQLLTDLHKHSFIEEKILVPYVSLLERKAK